MKTIFIIKKMNNSLKYNLVLFFLCTFSFFSNGQVSATEDFETEVDNSPTFSQGGITFSIAGTKMEVWYPGVNGNFGANSSDGYFQTLTNSSSVANDYNGQNVGGFQIQTAATSFKINSFACWTSNVVNLATQNSGIVKFYGTKPDGTVIGPVDRTIAPTGPNGAGWHLGITFVGTALENVQLTKLEFELPTNLKYFSIDDINFTTAAIVASQYSINDVILTEGNSGTKAFNFTVSRTQTSTTGSVNAATANGTATAGTDYTLVNTTINFAIGEASKTVTVTVNGDISPEPDENFFVNLTTPVNGNILDNQGIGTISDDDSITEMFTTESHNSQNFAEGGFSFSSTGSLLVSNSSGVGGSNCLDTRIGNGGNATGTVGTFGITTAATSFNIVSIDVFTSNNDGTTATTGSVTFTGTKADLSGTVTHTATITANGLNFTIVNFAGTPFEGIQLSSISVSIAAGINYVGLDNFKFGTGTITLPQFSIDDVTATEGSGAGNTNMIFTVSRTTNTTAGSVTVSLVHFTTVASDLVSAFAPQVINFSAGGALTQIVNAVAINRDIIDEPNETFNMVLSSPSAGYTILDGTGVGLINDDDGTNETFEGELNLGSTFSEDGISFTTTNSLKIRNGIGAVNSAYFLDTGLGNGGNAVGSVGTINIATPNKAFKLVSVDGWTSNNDGTVFATGVVTFKGNLAAGGTVETNKTITPTSNLSAGWQTNISFAGTPLENATLTSLEIIIVSGINYVGIDNFSFTTVNIDPEIEVSDASNNIILDGGVNSPSLTNNTDFGGTCVDGGMVSKTFTIKNLASIGTLNLSGSPKVELGGTSNSNFVITLQPNSPVNALGSTTFTIQFDPSVGGLQSASVSIANSDLDENPYNFSISGIGNSSPGTTITASNSVCQFATLNLSAPNGASTYVWSGEGIVLVNSDATTATPYSISSQTYKVVITSSNGCTATGTKTVVINARPTISAGASQTICKGTSAYILGNCIYNVYTTLGGGNEVPANASTATGIAYGTFNTITNQLTLNISFSGLSAAASVSHIHGPSATNSTGGVLIDFGALLPISTSGSFVYSATISDAIEGHLVAGLTYINIHSSAFPSGEIRGQLTALCAATSFNWTPGNLDGLGTTVSPVIGTTYTLTATNSATGCSNTSSTMVNVDQVTLPAAFSTATQTVSNVPLVANGCQYLAKVVPTNFTGNATVSVWVENQPAFPFLARHYEIVPAADPSTSSGTITLYYSQPDFTNYNTTGPTLLLPTNSSDLARIANFQLLKYAGTSMNGLPAGYMGAATTIPMSGEAWNSGAYSFVWNAVTELWEVTFPVSSFSGFFGKSVSQPLPVHLISFSGKKTGVQENTLIWKSTNEKDFDSFDIQKSENSKSFESIGKVRGNNMEIYEFVDKQNIKSSINAVSYYRLKMIDLDGKYIYSKIISVENNFEKNTISQFYPNPTTANSTIEINTIEDGNWSITVFDLMGKMVSTESKILQKGTNKISIEKLSKGVNFVRFENGKKAEIRKVIQE